MKRKIISLAGKTSVVSLPISWVKKYNIKKGDEIELEENGNNLIIKPKGLEQSTKIISIDTTDFTERPFRYAMSALHKLGYDEITLVHKKGPMKEPITDLIRNLLLGFVVIEQTSKRTVLRSMANEIDSEFDPALRRAFLVTISLAKSSLDMLSSEEFSNLPSLVNLEKTNNQLTSFCLRLISKGFYKDEEKKIFILTVIWNLEKIADEYKDICNELCDNKTKINPEILALYNEVISLLDGYYELFYKFNREKINDLDELKNKIQLTRKKINSESYNEIFLLTKLMTLTSKISDMSSSVTALHHRTITSQPFQ